MGLLRGLPDQWRYVLTGGEGNAKRAFEAGWNQPGHGRTLDAVIRLNTTPKSAEGWISRKCIGLGVITGEESGGLLVMDFDGSGSQSVRAFRQHFRRFPSELPTTLATISGKHGRAKLFFQVPPDYWSQLEGRSAVWCVSEGVVALEAIWANTTNTSRHAVIVGDHPDSSHQKPLFYRWAPGRSPDDVGLAEAPDWLVLGMLAAGESKGETPSVVRQRSGEDDATPWNLLSTYERRELVEDALEYCPNRKAKGSGTYDKVRRILCGLINEFGLPWAEEIVTNSRWDEKNEWGDTDAVKTMRSLAKSRVADNAKSRIASLFYFAREGKWQPPSWGVPPADVQVEFEGFQKLVNQMVKEHQNSARVAVLIGRARKEYGVDAETVRRETLSAYLGERMEVKPRGADDIKSDLRKDNIYTDVIDGFLGRRVHLVAGASHAGKTTLACFLANRVVHGLPIDIDSIRHPVGKPGKVLILTSDCSDHDMLRDLALEGIGSDVGSDRLRIVSGITFNRMISIANFLEDFAPDLVVYDCLASMACTGVKIGDPAYGEPLRDLTRYNGVAWPKCAHVVLHHTTRDEPTRFSGTEQVKAAAEELWLYYPPELAKWKRGQPLPEIGMSRVLRFEKSRTGFAGKKLSLTRNALQGNWQVHLTNPESSGPMDMLTYRLRGLSDDEWRIASELQKLLDLEFHPRTLRRHLDALVGTVLETKKLRSRVTGREETHYRPTSLIRVAAGEMKGSRGDGVNEV